MVEYFRALGLILQQCSSGGRELAVGEGSIRANMQVQPTRVVNQQIT